MHAKTTRFFGNDAILSDFERYQLVKYLNWFKKYHVLATVVLYHAIGGKIP